ncbi:hypothetical protein [Bacillus solitudinis]|uniref:hypothetical protein n=1 Tax=Bacillus solitudinis TaxID=2014074 RepID=UPI000C24503B|nr:hypothetical protein [Bacillus solitudinis]
MMKLSTMKKVFETVDSKWKSQLADLILEKWGYDKGSVFCLRASANFIFIFQKEGKRYYLRFNDSCERGSNWAEGLSVTEENFGLIHYDFELDNVLIEN